MARQRGACAQGKPSGIRLKLPCSCSEEWRFSPVPAPPWEQLEPVLPASGSMTWNIELLGISPDYPRVEPDDIWALMRYVAATLLRSVPEVDANVKAIADPNNIFLTTEPAPQVEGLTFLSRRGLVRSAHLGFVDARPPHGGAQRPHRQDSPASCGGKTRPILGSSLQRLH